MRVVIYSNGAGHQLENANRFICGLRRHGITDAKVAPTAHVQPCDLAVTWGHRQNKIYAHQKKHHAHYLVMERGYIGDRFQFTSFGFNGLNGRATFPDLNDGGARWNKHFAKFMQPWKMPTTTTVVIMGQVHGDAALANLADFPGWVEMVGDEASKLGFNPLFRPHPSLPNVEFKQIPTAHGTLDQALGSARLVVTYNSNSGVDAIMAGVPTVACDGGSMVWDVALKFIPRRVDYFADRRNDRWKRKMAFAQWLPAEVESGAAWEALKTVLEKWETKIAEGPAAGATL